MKDNQSLEMLTADAMLSVSQVLKKVTPDLVLVQGDTTTAMVAALSSFYQKIPVGHIEAGLRTNNVYNPFPEEINRNIISRVSALNFAPTKKAFRTLLNEGIQKEKLFLTGNTIVDALRIAARQERNIEINCKQGSRIILVTAHRRENFGKPLKNICRALKAIIQRNPDVEIVYPVHLNPNVRVIVYKILGGIKRVHLMEPLEYDALAYILKKSYLILTDSGGIQEEAPTFSKPVLVLRNETERQEGVEAGVAKIVGTEPDNIIRSVEKLLDDTKAYNKMARAISPYGDGYAAKRIIARIISFAKDRKK